MSILGPLYFNTFLNDLLFFNREAELCNFADDNTLFSAAKTLAEVVDTLVVETRCVIHWFEINSLAVKSSKVPSYVSWDK